MSSITNYEIAMNLMKNGNVLNVTNTPEFTVWLVKSLGHVWRIIKTNKKPCKWIIHQLPYMKGGELE